MIKRLYFLLLAIVIAVSSYYLASLSQTPLFSYGVSFIGFTVAALLMFVATLKLE